MFIPAKILDYHVIFVIQAEEDALDSDEIDRLWDEYQVENK